jgi:small GTP-binding protein
MLYLWWGWKQGLSKDDPFEKRRKLRVANSEQNHLNGDDQQKKKLTSDTWASIFRKTERPRTANEFGMVTLKYLPANLNMVQGFMKAVNWKAAQQEVLEGLNNTIVIVGLPNTGKSTLFNKIKGQNLSLTSAQAGSTRALVRADFGPFTLVDTPGHLPDIMQSGLTQASVIVFLIDASKGLQAEDRELFGHIKPLNKPTIVVINKVDALKEESGDHLATEIAIALDTPGVIPISAKTGQNIAEELIPLIIETSPEAALAIGHELPAYRRQAAQRVIRTATLVGLAAGLEPIPFIDIPILLGTQLRLVLRLAALYGKSIDDADVKKHASQMIATLVGGLSLRLLAEQAAKAVPFGGDFVAGAIAAAATWSIGQVAFEYYEGDGRISPKRLRDLYRSFYSRFRKDHQFDRDALQKLSKQSLREIEKSGIAPALDIPRREEVLEEGSA